MEEAAFTAEKGEVQVDAVIVKDGRAIAHAHNEREALQDPMVPAEILALRRAAAVRRSRRLHDVCDPRTLSDVRRSHPAVGLDQVIFGAWDAWVPSMICP